ncbi:MULTISPECIES: LLM class flavin-dependent oxidoreductase [unclassified Rathayibacter]|uniref:LLM class flavin-dependent oxidoreductase n=1 Tax=unclassified Rathayibacter TaxID=2609250 RepID=UPI000CE7CF8D|nr:MULTISPECIES: LLM class flavin-dependent oxidoreductase [unclassified Rathayibacter]PPH19172.1 FMNH2-dependent monooxygenase [Rathayibacter sp. AY1F8]PPH72236.1 FMNH2-dependent monooxygenase [Rathayibacter sp. AY1D4]
MTAAPPLSLAVALEGAGWHPASWREPGARPDALFTGAYWADIVQRAERGGIDFVTIEDSFALQSADPFLADDRTDEVRGRLDALLIASYVAPLTSRIGLVPTVTVTHTEPFHVSKAVATLDHLSRGRGGWQVRVSSRVDEASHVGRRIVAIVPPEPGTPLLEDPAIRAVVDELFEEAADAVEVARRLWDSWEDDAEIRDVATDRFLDADKVHRVDFAGRWFSVRGPAITPRPPQGQPVVAALAHADIPYRFAARSADVVFATPQNAADAERILQEIAEAERGAGRTGERLRVLADLVVVLDTPAESAAARLSRLDALGRPLTGDAAVAAGSAASVADRIAELSRLGYDGVRLRPAVLATDLPLIADDLVPELRRRGLLVGTEEGRTLRSALGLPTSIPNRYASEEQS